MGLISFFISYFFYCKKITYFHLKFQTIFECFIFLSHFLYFQCPIILHCSLLVYLKKSQLPGCLIYLFIYLFEFTDIKLFSFAI